MISILVTGGAGYIGSHTCVELLAAGHTVIVFDNFSNSDPEAVQRVQRITGQSLVCVRGDVCDESALKAVIEQYGCQSVIHFAGLKAVGESVEKPLDYYDNNVAGTLCLLRAMHATGVRSLIFSSSATVYGEPKYLPLTENHPLSATNPYARSKLFIENMLGDLYRSDGSWCIAILRYFNPVGAHESGLIGEDPQGLPNNLMPFVAQVATGRRAKLNIWGGDYSTPDGTGVRDYIHVVDLAKGHVQAMQFLDGNKPQCLAINLGTGKGFSVLEMIHAFEKASGRKIAYQIVGRRSGDVAECYADPQRAWQLLGWRADRTIMDMCVDAWRWQVENPDGYTDNL